MEDSPRCMAGPYKAVHWTDPMIKILFLAANPKDTDRLRLDEEVRAIKERLRLADLRDQFVVEQELAVRVTDLQGFLLRHKPHIVHFSGHGSNAGEIVLEDAVGQSQPVLPWALQSTFAVLKAGIRCVVLNACYSEAQARGIAKSIDCVVGMTRAIGDESAIAFAGSFYQALGYGKTLPEAFELGCAQIDLEGLCDADVPKLTVAKGVDAAGFYLATNPASEPAEERQKAVAGKVPRTFNVIGTDVRPPPIRPLLRALELALSDGDLQDSELGPDVLATLRDERGVELARSFDPSWMIAAIRVADSFFTAIRLSAGQRNWQRDFAKSAMPVLVGTAWSLARSPDAQAVVLSLCDVIAKRLRLKLMWPTDADSANDLKNAIYDACLDASELESDDVLMQLQGMTVTGPV